MTKTKGSSRYAGARIGNQQCRRRREDLNQRDSGFRAYVSSKDMDGVSHTTLAAVSIALLIIQAISILLT